MTPAPMTDATISRAGPADLDALAALFDAYRQFYGQPSDVPRARDWLRSRLRVGESVVLLARREGAIVGFVQLYPMFSSVRTAKTWILNDLYVDASARRGGVADARLRQKQQGGHQANQCALEIEVSHLAVPGGAAHPHAP